MPTNPPPVWRLLDSGFADGATNMAVDEAILAACAAGKAPPTLRFFAWRPPCLSLGYFQAARREVDLRACAERGVEVVRRPTGGRAVLHDEEVTYSLVAPADDPRVSGGTIESYRKISAGLVAGLARLGVEAELAPPQVSALYANSAACFDTAVDYELTVGGRKIVGSAQMRREGVVLQHGSILLAFDAAALSRLLRAPAAPNRDSQAARLAQHATDLREVLDRPVTADEVVAAMTAGFGEALGIDLEPRPLSPDEQEMARALVGEKYGNGDWNFRR